jgi:hypothetical protein
VDYFKARYELLITYFRTAKNWTNKLIKFVYQA